MELRVHASATKTQIESAFRVAILNLYSDKEGNAERICQLHAALDVMENETEKLAHLKRTCPHSPGTKVQLVGLREKPELNGVIGVAEEWDGLRLQISIGSCTIAVKPKNVIAASPAGSSATCAPFSTAAAQDAFWAIAGNLSTTSGDTARDSADAVGAGTLPPPWSGAPLLWEPTGRTCPVRTPVATATVTQRKSAKGLSAFAGDLGGRGSRCIISHRHLRYRRRSAGDSFSGDRATATAEGANAATGLDSFSGSQTFHGLGRYDKPCGKRQHAVAQNDTLPSRSCCAALLEGCGGGDTVSPGQAESAHALGSFHLCDYASANLQLAESPCIDL